MENSRGRKEGRKEGKKEWRKEGRKRKALDLHESKFSSGHCEVGASDENSGRAQRKGDNPSVKRQPAHEVTVTRSELDRSAKNKQSRAYRYTQTHTRL